MLNPKDIGSLPSLSLIGAALYAASLNGNSLDLRGSGNFIGQMKIMLDAGAPTGTTPTLAVTLQDSPDNTTFTNIPNAAFTPLTTNASLQSLALDVSACNRYIRAVLTITGTTPSYPVSIQAVGVRAVFP